MSRNLEPTTIKKFQGLDVWATLTSSSPERATDLINVIPSGSGGIEKLRIPVTLSTAVTGQSNGPDTFAQFSNSNTGIRQVIAQFGNVLGVFSSGWVFTQLDTNALNSQGEFEYVVANNLFFGTNGARNFKWDGTNFTNWGIAAPSGPPSITTLPAPAATPINIAAAANPINLIAATVQRTNNISTAQVSGLTPGLNVGDICQIAGVSNTSFNAIAPLLLVFTVSGINTGFTYANNGPNASSTGGTITDFNQSGIFRYNNEVTVTTTTPHGLSVGTAITIAGVTDTSFNGNFVVDSIISTTQFTYPQIGVAGFSGGGTETPHSVGIFANGGRKYKISFSNSKTGHVGNASAASPATGNLVGSISTTVTCPAPTDPQVDTAYLWCTLDGGGDFYLNQIHAIPLLTAPIFYDTLLDSQINTAIIAPLVNTPPIVGKYVTKWNSRICVLNLVGDAQGMIYSGYERILIGRPEESFPPNNRLRLAIGADGLRGAAALSIGLVLFSQSNQMFLLRGSLQDITVDAPVQPSTFLQELPWKMGSFSGFSVIETPQGVCFLGSDKTIQLLSPNASALSCLSIAFNPILRRITPGTESTVRACYFNYLERDWYCLSAPLDGSQINNFIVIVDLDPDPTKNVGAFLWSLEADAIGVIEDINSTRQLVISNGGLIKQVLATSDTIGGISNPITSTTGTLRAYWVSGVFGNTDAQAMKQFRWARAVVDQTDFQVSTILYGEEDNLRFPVTSPPAPLPGDGRISTNLKGRRLQYHIEFPLTDASANLLELTSVHIPLSER